jgi:ubiquinol-cytochrome c reductase iron-sulfur subunit
MTDHHTPGSDIEHADNSGLPPHKMRRTDLNPATAKRAERQVSLFFVVSALTAIGSIVAFFAYPIDQLISLPFLGEVSALNAVVGSLMGISILAIGLGAIHWARKLMTDHEIVQERHDLSSSYADRKAALDDFWEGAEASGFVSRKIIRRSLLGAMALFPLPIIVLFKDLGPMPGTSLRHTIWKAGEQIVTDPQERRIRPEDIPVGGLVNAMPASLTKIQDAQGNSNEGVKSVIVLVRMRPDEIVAQQGPNWDYQGILAYSKVCTHLGCPISLYEQRTHHLLCPCHQSTFDLSDAGKVVFGPARRHMPQLPITVDADGYLVAVSDFAEPIGPSFWERG